MAFVIQSTDSVGTGTRITPANNSAHLIEEGVKVVSTSASVSAIQNTTGTGIGLTINGTVLGEISGVNIAQSTSSASGNSVRVGETGLVMGQDFAGINLGGDSATVINYGTVASETNTAVNLYAETGTHLVENHGLIASYGTGSIANSIYFNAAVASHAGVVRNYGEITTRSAEAAAIDFSGSGNGQTVENYGSIFGVSDAIEVTEGAALTLINGGSISGTIDLSDEADVITNLAGGVLTSGGLDLDTGADQIVNDGLMLSTGTGIFAEAGTTKASGARIVNGGTIQAGVDGVNLPGTDVTVESSGRIEAAGSGVVLPGAGSHVLNTGTITAERYGISAIGADSSVVNRGTIAAKDENAIFAGSGSNIRVVNEGTVTSEVKSTVKIGTATSSTAVLTNSGTIAHLDGGVGVEGDDANSDRVVNSGVIDGSVSLGGQGDRLENSGEITGRVDLGTSFSSDTVVNSGLIAGGLTAESAIVLNTADGRLVDLAGVAARFTNTSDVTNLGSIIGGSTGMELAGALSVLVNAGTIRSFNFDGVTVDGDGSTIENSGFISGFSAGVKFNTTNGTVINSGTILSDGGSAIEGASTVHNTGILSPSTAGFSAVVGTTNADLVTNTGDVQGGVSLGGDADRLVNSGLIGGDVTLGDGDDLYRGRGDGSVEGTVEGGQGEDTLIGGREGDQLDGGTEDDFVRGGGGDDTMIGGDGEDTLLGGQGDDSADGGNNTDRIFGGAGDDTLNDSLGWNLLYGGLGDDSLTTGSGQDQLRGGRGDDTLNGGTSRDSLFGGAGDDVLKDTSGWNLMRGGSGDDELTAGSGQDQLFGGSGADTLNGGSSSDTLDGGAGDDVIDDESGWNRLSGGSGNDAITASGSGRDTISGGTGIDTLTGGTDRDVFVYRPGDEADLVTDFENGLDRVDLTAWSLTGYADLIATASVTSTADGSQIDFGAGDVLKLDGLAFASVDASDFVF